MASPLNAVLCALIGIAFWTVLGYAIARHLLPRVLAIGAAPVIGWAVFSATTLPILTLLGLILTAIKLGLTVAAWVQAHPEFVHDAKASLDATVASLEAAQSHVQGLRDADCTLPMHPPGGSARPLFERCRRQRTGEIVALS